MIKQPPFELRLLGDEATARLFVGRAKQIFYNLINGLDPDVKTITRDYELDPRGGIKGVIRVYKSFDINIVTIHAEAPELEKIPEPYRKIWEPWNGTNENICTDHLWEFNMRTGQSPPVAFHSTVTDFYGAAADPVSGYPGIPALTNPSLCNLAYTWPVTGPYADSMYWADIIGGTLYCEVDTLQGNASYRYSTFNVIWDNRTLGGSPGDPINPYTNADAQFCELAVNVSADADPGYGFSEPPHVILSTSCAFYMTDGINIHVWYLGIDELLYNDNGYIPPGDRPYVSTLGDAFNVGANGVFLLKLEDYGFTGDIVRVGFNWEYPGSLGGKDTGTGRNMILRCDYIDFY